MPPLITVCPFTVAGVLVTPELVGESFYVECRGDPVLLALGDPPSAEEGESRFVRSLTVVVGFDDLLGERRSRVQTMVAGFRSASETATSFLEWLRVDLGHTWLGARPQLAGPVELVDIGADGGRSLHRSEWPSLPSERLLDRELAEAIAIRISRGRPVPLARSLLAEADHLVWPDVSAEAGRAIVSAAAAAEVAVKARLLARATPSTRDLLELEMDRLPTVELFGSIAGAVLDRSLQQEDGPLFTRLGRLFRERERIAGPGESPMMTGQQARALVDTARATIEWLETV